MDRITDRLPGWFRVLFIVVMLLLCAFLCWYAPGQVALRFQVDDVTLSLDTSRQREAKQQYEYDQVVEELPRVQAQLAELAPQAETAQAKEAELRASRKELRAANKELAQQLDDVQAGNETLNQQIEALTAQIHDLTARQAALLNLIQSYQDALSSLDE